MPTSRTRKPARPLAGHVAVVAGSTRGAGRGIARALGQAGATVCVTEANWRHGGKKDRNFLESESPLFVGRAVAALVQDPRILHRTGQLLGERSGTSRNSSLRPTTVGAGVSDPEGCQEGEALNKRQSNQVRF